MPSGVHVSTSQLKPPSLPNACPVPADTHSSPEGSELVAGRRKQQQRIIEVIHGAVLLGEV